DMELRNVENLIKALDASGISEVVIEDGDSRVTVRKADAPATGTGAGGGLAAAPVAAAPVAAPAAAPAAAPVAAEAAPAAAANERPASWKAITAPMVGTYYASPSPEAGPFVTVGDSVKAGDAICILEAMKLMNELTIDEDGIIREILAENADALGFGDTIMYYEPA
ncbi:MAG: acetyl-CoA carboxylase biotin carboxyl carrier protein, partial [Coriobacteriia bacterium]|nr:acetyl-CoA carboxylase biotin carboxyl carrier protein [Coriobacteriia bacterium]